MDMNTDDTPFTPARGMHIAPDGELVMIHGDWASAGYPPYCPNCNNPVVYVRHNDTHYCTNMHCGYKENILIEQLVRLNISVSDIERQYILDNARVFGYDLLSFIEPHYAPTNEIEASIVDKLKHTFKDGVYPSQICELLRVPSILKDYYLSFDNLYTSIRAWVMSMQDVNYCQRTNPAFDYEKQCIISQYINTNMMYCQRFINL